ncbi:hypothetical protein KM043_009275 [Ampulex compressa]|nr:hypothetical protein KM043_009275 [Ampulex compressa]
MILPIANPGLRRRRLEQRSRRHLRAYGGLDCSLEELRDLVCSRVTLIDARGASIYSSKVAKVCGWKLGSGLEHRYSSHPTLNVDSRSLVDCLDREESGESAVDSLEFEYNAQRVDGSILSVNKG